MDVGCIGVENLSELRQDGRVDAFLLSDDNDLILEKSFSESLSLSVKRSKSSMTIPGGSWTSAPMAELCLISSGSRLKVRLVDSGIVHF